MHDLNLAYKMDGTVLFRSLPGTVFCTAPDQSFRNRPLFHSLEASASRRPFAPPRRLLPFESHRSEINAPGLSLSHHSEFSTGPFGCQLPPPRSLLSRGRSALTARCQFTIQNSQANRLRPLPFGISSRQIVALHKRRTREAYLNVGPIPLHSPRPAIAKSIALFPAHRSRFATFIRLTALFTS